MLASPSFIQYVQVAKQHRDETKPIYFSYFPSFMSSDISAPFFHEENETPPILSADRSLSPARTFDVLKFDVDLIVGAVL
jgi:hypothetical protein